jgi:phage shock protein A
MKKVRLTREAAQAVLSNDLPMSIYVPPKHADTLVAIAKTLQRAQTRRAKLRKQLSQADQEVKQLKKYLKALCDEVGRRTT